MNRKVFGFILLATCLTQSVFAAETIKSTQTTKDFKMARVTGIGGVFFKSTKDHKALAAWYQKHLGMTPESFGPTILKWEEDKAEDKGLTVWHVAEKDSEWFGPSNSSFMINYRIDDMEAMIAQLKRGGVDILKGPESHENGKFAWIMDPDGNKVELWEPKNWDEKNKNP